MALKIRRDGKPGPLVVVEIRGDKLRNAYLIKEDAEPTFTDVFPIIEGARFLVVKTKRTKTTLEFWRTKP